MSEWAWYVSLPRMPTLERVVAFAKLVEAHEHLE